VINDGDNNNPRNRARCIEIHARAVMWSCGVPKKVCPPSSTSYKMASKNPSPWRLAIPSAPDTGPAAPPHRRRRRPFPPPLEERSSGGRPVDSLGPSLWAPRQSTRSLRPPSGPAGRQRRRWRRQRCWGSSSRR
jgi:hypothetical protein